MSTPVRRAASVFHVAHASTRRQHGPLSTSIRVLGLVVAFAALEHGIGEALQGPGAPASLAIESWPDSQPFAVVSGEPALTVIPDLLLAGLVTIALAIAFAAWSWVAGARPRGGSGLVVLSVLLLLSGGGIAPPVIGIILGVALGWPLRRSVAGWRAAVARAWQPLLVLAVVAYLSLVPGLVAASAIVDADLTLAAIVLPLVAFFGLFATLCSARWAEASG